MGTRVAGERISKEYNNRVTRGIVAALVPQGYMIDYTTSEDGEYMRVVCNRSTNDQIVANLLKTIIECGENITNAA